MWLFDICTQQTVHLEDLFGLGKSKSHLAVLADVDKEIGLQRVYLLIARRIAFLSETEDNPFGNHLILRMRWDDSVKPERCILKTFSIALNIIHQVDTEVVKGEFVECNTFIEILKI